MVPIPRFNSWEDLNAHLEQECRRRRERRLRGHTETTGERFERDHAALLPLPAAPCEACEKVSARVSSLALVRYRGNDYSVPTQYGHRQVWVKGYVHQVVIACGSEVIARHARSYEREAVVFDPLHYLALLEQKTRALDQAAPLTGWQLPECFTAAVSMCRCCDCWRPSTSQKSHTPSKMRCSWARSASTRSVICCCAVSSEDRRGWIWRTIHTCR